MDALLKLLADASLEVAAAEASLEEQAHHTAAEQLDAAESRLADLRAAWPAMAAAQRGVVGPAAGAIRIRLEAARRRIPRLSALSVGVPEADPEQEAEPEP